MDFKPMEFLSYNSGCFLSSLEQQIVSYICFSLKKQCLMVIAVVMILRVWAMYHQSRSILGVLLVFYSMEVVVNIIVCIIYSIPGRIRGALDLISWVIALMRPSVCSGFYSSSEFCALFNSCHFHVSVDTCSLPYFWCSSLPAHDNSIHEGRDSNIQAEQAMAF